jgi:hypothetical protein
MLSYRLSEKSSMHSNPALIFIHIPKAAGSTLQQIVHRQFPESKTFHFDPLDPKASVQKLKSMPREKRSELECISGHMPFGMHKYLPQPATYITMLRDPVERMLSFYFYIRRTQIHYLHDTVVSRDMSLEEVMKSNLTSELDNDQTRRLSGLSTGDAVADWFKIGGAALDQAKKNIKDFFSVVGVTEKFDESVLLMKRRLGWKNIFYRRQNVSLSRPAESEVHPSILDVIRKRNYYDIQLYQWVERRLSKSISAMGPGFDAELRIFKFTNGIGNKTREIARPAVHLLRSFKSNICP